MISYYTNETLKSTAQDIKNDFEISGATWEGVALEIARLQLGATQCATGHGGEGSWAGELTVSGIREDRHPIDFGNGQIDLSVPVQILKDRGDARVRSRDIEIGIVKAPVGDGGPCRDT